MPYLVQKGKDLLSSLPAYRERVRQQNQLFSTSGEGAALLRRLEIGGYARVLPRLSFHQFEPGYTNQRRLYNRFRLPPYRFLRAFTHRFAPRPYQRHARIYRYRAYRRIVYRRYYRRRRY